MSVARNNTSPDAAAQLAAMGSTLLTSAAERDQANLDRLIRIKENIERHAKKDVERLHKMIDKREHKEQFIEINIEQVREQERKERIRKCNPHRRK
jgi:hypothetical protein